MAEISAGNLYDMNKTLVKKYEVRLKGESLEKRISEVVIPYLKEKIISEKYFMLLCHEKRDYTVFHNNEKENSLNKIVKSFKECLKNRGSIYGIDRTPDDVALEVWIKSIEDDEMSCYYFFPYTQAVIEA